MRVVILFRDILEKRSGINSVLEVVIVLVTRRAKVVAPYLKRGEQIPNFIFLLLKLEITLDLVHYQNVKVIEGEMHVLRDNVILDVALEVDV